MPHSFATLKGERTISTLARRLFFIEGRGRPEALRVAEAALLRANPQLRRPAGFRTGRIVVVPEDTGLKPTDRVNKVEGGVGGALDDATIRLKLASQLLEDEVESGGEAAEKTLKQLSDRRFLTQLRKAEPQSAKVVPQTVKSVKARIEATAKTKELYARALRQAQAEIDRLKQRTQRDG